MVSQSKPSVHYYLDMSNALASSLLEWSQAFLGLLLACPVVGATSGEELSAMAFERGSRARRGGGGVFCPYISCIRVGFGEESLLLGQEEKRTIGGWLRDIWLYICISVIKRQRI